MTADFYIFFFECCLGRFEFCLGRFKSGGFYGVSTNDLIERIRYSCSGVL